MAGLWPDGGRWNFVDIAFEFEALCAVSGLDGVDHIVEILERLFYREAQRGILVRRNSAADSRLPFNRMSSMEISEASLTGFHHEATNHPIPTSTRLVRPAQYARYCSGLGCIE